MRSMRALRRISLLLVPALTLLVFAPEALALAHSGQGLYGPTDDKTITEWMLGLLVFFPTIIVVFSLLQSWLDHRKHARMDAAKARASAPEWRGGW
jgi:uncharacterized BrkB/YihY/UPF0761 family membrane protein